MELVAVLKFHSFFCDSIVAVLVALYLFFVVVYVKLVATRSGRVTKRESKREDKVPLGCFIPPYLGHVALQYRGGCSEPASDHGWWHIYDTSQFPSLYVQVILTGHLRQSVWVARSISDGQGQTEKRKSGWQKFCPFVTNQSMLTLSATKTSNRRNRTVPIQRTSGSTSFIGIHSTSAWTNGSPALV